MKLRTIGIIFLFLFILVSCKKKYEEIYLPPTPLEFYSLEKCEQSDLEKSIFNILKIAYSYNGADITYSEAKLIYLSVEEELKKYDWLTSSLVYGVIEIESEFKKCAKNSNNNLSSDYSYMQINDISKTDYNNHNWENPVTVEELQNDTRVNIMVGCWVLNKKRERLIKAGIEPTEENIIMAYNCGESKVIRDRVPQCTIDYQKKVLISKANYESNNSINFRLD